MLRRGIEDKAATKPSRENVYVSPYTDKPIRREDLEDPEHPGHMKAALFPCTPDNWNAAVHYRLRTSSGRQSWPVAQSVDPSHVSVSEAPANLREDLARAQGALDAHCAKMRQIQDRLVTAEIEVRQGAAEQNKQRYNAAIAAGMSAEEEQRALMMEEPPLVKRLADANRALKFWQDDERMFRTGAVPRPEPSVVF